MKHTFTGRHGHMFRMGEKKRGDPFNFEKFCISAKEAAESDMMVEKLEGAWRVSRRYHTCWQCYEPTEMAGGYDDPAGKKILFFECKTCDPRARSAKK